MSTLSKIFGDNRWQVLATLCPIMIDGLHFLVFEQVNDVFYGMLAEPSAGSLGLLLGLYTAFIISIFFIGRLVPDVRLATVTLESTGDDGIRRKTKTTWPKLLFVYPTFGFGIVVVMMIMMAMGIGQEVPVLSDNAEGAFMIGVVLLFCVHAAAAVVDIEPKHRSSSPAYLRTLVPAVIISELMLNLAMAAWIYFLADAGATPQPGRPGKLADMLWALPLFLIFFAAPRFTFMSKSFTWPTLVSGLALIVYELWGTLDLVGL